MDAAVGEVIGGYRLERLIGAGSTSQVFLGSHVRLGRKAAIKVLSHQLLDNQDVVSRLLQEARIVNDIRHPNIIDIIDFVESESPRRVALVMEYIEGPSLKALRDHKHSFEQALGMALQLVQAVEAAHAAGVIHRDIKPDNLLLTTDPRTEPSKVPVLKMVDFGIAKLAGPGGGRTAAGTMLGTPAYMAPEQVAGRPPPSPATDVFAVGEVIYELFTGTRAYPATTIHETVRAKLRGEVPELKLPPIPGEKMLLDLIVSCLQRKPPDRPSLPEVRRVLESLRLGAAGRSTMVDMDKHPTMPPMQGASSGSLDVLPPPPPPGRGAAHEPTLPPDDVWRQRGAAPPAAATELSPIGSAMNALSQLAQQTTAVRPEPFPNAGAVPTRPNELPPIPGTIRFPPNEASSPTNKTLPALNLADLSVQAEERAPSTLRPEPVSYLATDEITNLPTRVIDAIGDVAPLIEPPSMPFREAVTSTPERAGLLSHDAVETPAEMRGIMSQVGMSSISFSDDAQKTRITEIKAPVLPPPEPAVQPGGPLQKPDRVPWLLLGGVLLLLIAIVVLIAIR